MKIFRFFALFLLIFLFLPSSYLQAQSAKWDWVKSGPTGTYYESVFWGIVIDDYGNTYVCGSFNDTVKIGNGTNADTFYSKGYDDIMVAKYNAKGSLVWLKTAGTPNVDEAYYITMDKKGRIYVAGYFNENGSVGVKLDFGNNISILSDTASDIFVACYDTSGIIKWAVTSDRDYLSDIHSDSIGNCITTGGITNYGGGPGGTNLSSVFVDEYDTTGNIVFFDTYASDGQDASGSYGIADGITLTWDVNDNFYVAGIFSSDITIDGAIHYANTLQNYQTASFLVKYNSNHKIQWVKYFEEKEGDVNIWKNGTDKNGNLYLAGNYTSIFSSSSFLNADGTFLPINDSFWNHIYLSSFDTGGKINWLKDISKNDDINGLAIDSIGNIYLTGWFTDTVSFGFERLFSLGANDAFVTKYNNNGIAQWALKGGSKGLDGGIGIGANVAGDINLTGYWGENTFDTAWFGNILITQKNKWGSTFLAHLSPCTPASATLSSLRNLNFCMGDTIHTILKASSHDTGNIYTWEMNDSVLYTGRDSIFQAFAVGSYSVIVNNTDSTRCTGYSNTITISYYPQSKINFTKATANCRDTLRADTSAGHIYQWYLNDTIISGANSKTYLATISGKYNLETTNTHRCTTKSTGVQVTISGIPNATVSNGKTSFCQGDSVKVLFIAKTASGDTYQWYKDSAILTGNTAHTYTTTDTGIFQVLVTSGAGCQKFSSPVDVIINPLPQTPTITQSTDTLISSAATGNQWFKGNTLIKGAISQKYIALTNGNYSVMVTDSNGCAATSKTVNYTTTGIEKETGNPDLYIYPNPSHNTFNIQVQNQNSGEAEVCLTDIVGHQVARFSIKDKNNFTINAADYSMKSGVYILSIQSGNDRYVGKLVVE